MNKRETIKILDIGEITAESSAAFWGRACARAVKKIRQLQKKLSDIEKFCIDNAETEWAHSCYTESIIKMAKKE